MHPNPIFHTQDAQQNLDYARKRAFGVLCINGSKGPLMAHVPFLLSPQGDFAELHLVRSNPIGRALTEALDAKIAVSGGDSYVSPDWYEVDDQVPTWNYVALELSGRLQVLPQTDLRELLDRQSLHFEMQLHPKPPWQTSKMTEEVLERMMRQIIPVRFEITSVDGTYKLSQNKPETVRARTAEAISKHQMGQNIKEIYALMRDL